jgi:hypothetical protein
MKSHAFYKQIAHRLDHEYIVDQDGDVCIRPMHCNNEGVRQVSLYPDPCEFVPLPQAISKLAKLWKNQDD